MKSIWKYPRISRYLSLDFGRAHLVGKILECWRDKFRMVMEVLNSMEGHTGFLSRRSRYFHSLHNKFRFRRSACYQQVTVWAFHERRNGWPRWTRLSWWSCRSYPAGIIPLSFCLAVRCWLEVVTITKTGRHFSCPPKCCLLRWVSKVVVAMNMIGLFPMTPLVCWDGRMDTLYWKFLFIHHHWRICSRKKRRNMVGVSESGSPQKVLEDEHHIYGRWTWHSPRDHEGFKSRCSDAGRMSCSLLLPTRRWKSGRFCAADLDSRTVSQDAQKSFLKRWIPHLFILCIRIYDIRLVCSKWNLTKNSVSKFGELCRIPRSQGIAGECAVENKLIVIDDA